MNNNHDDDCADHTNRMPSLLSIFDPIRNDDMQGIIPNALSELESDAVFGQVSSGLVQIPFEVHVSFMYVQYCTYILAGLQDWRFSLFPGSRAWAPAALAA